MRRISVSSRTAFKTRSSKDNRQISDGGFANGRRARRTSPSFSNRSRPTTCFWRLPAPTAMSGRGGNLTSSTVHILNALRGIWRKPRSMRRKLSIRSMSSFTARGRRRRTGFQIFDLQRPRIASRLASNGDLAFAGRSAPGEPRRGFAGRNDRKCRRRRGARKLCRSGARRRRRDDRPSRPRPISKSDGFGHRIAFASLDDHEKLLLLLLSRRKFKASRDRPAGRK